MPCFCFSPFAAAKDPGFRGCQCHILTSSEPGGRFVVCFSKEETCDSIMGDCQYCYSQRYHNDIFHVSNLMELNYWIVTFKFDAFLKETHQFRMQFVQMHSTVTSRSDRTQKQAAEKLKLMVVCLVWACTLGFHHMTRDTTWGQRASCEGLRESEIFLRIQDFQLKYLKPLLRRWRQHRKTTRVNCAWNHR